MTDIVFVCTGNTCRSPYAEAYARSRAAERGLESVRFTSAGLGILPGAPATEPAVRVARERGLDLSDHIARDFAAQPGTADRVLVMSARHLEALPAGVTGALLGAGDIGDPYGGDDGAYRRAYDEIERAVDRLLDQLEAAARR